MSKFSNERLSKQFKVASFYSFSRIDEDTLNSLPSSLISIAKNSQVRGTVLVALEGINGTICGPSEGVKSLLCAIQECGLENFLQIKYSWTSKQAFRRFKARSKPEIVTMGIAGVNPNESVGTYVEPEEWNHFLDDPNTLVIDTRNEYEVSIGTFKGAVNPHTSTFSEFPSWADQNLKPFLNKERTKKIAMFCTGGIRCEKATSYLKKEGFSEVHHLHGGILRYLEEIPQAESRWEGECFVFDQRVALNHNLMPGIHRLCYACGMPLSPEDRDNPTYIAGIQCCHCLGNYTEEDRARFAERQKYINELSKRLPYNSVWPNA